MSKSEKNRQVSNLNKPNELQSGNLSVALKVASHFQGPLPHPAILKAYDLVLPGLAEKIVGGWEKQTEHRMSLERTVISGDDKRANWGLISATSISITIVVACVVLALNNKEQSLAALGVIVLDIASLAGVFVYGSRSRRVERERKAAQVKLQPEQNKDK
jgi:uncharacterized membrane protein